MRKTTKVLAIYRELREAAGRQVGAAEALSCAALLVKLFAEDDGGRWEMAEERLSLDATPVDQMLTNGGWELLSREWDRLGWDDTDNCGGACRDWRLA